MELFVRSFEHPRYLVSTEGRVYSEVRRRFLTPIVAKRGFLQVSMDGRNVSLHKEVAESFQRSKVVRVWFKDKDKHNCRLSNLEYARYDVKPGIIEMPPLYKYEDGKFVPLAMEECEKIWTSVWQS